MSALFDVDFFCIVCFLCVLCVRFHNKIINKNSSNSNSNMFHPSFLLLLFVKKRKKNLKIGSAYITPTPRWVTVFGRVNYLGV